MDSPSFRGDPNGAEAILRELERRADASYVGGTVLAVVYAALGDLDQAFGSLDRAYPERDVSLVHIALRRGRWRSSTRATGA